MSKSIIFDEKYNRATLLPIQDHNLWELHKKQESCFWTADGIDLSSDRDNFKKLPKNYQHFIKNILAFFAWSDGVVSENIMERFLKEVKMLEVKYFYQFQGMMENIHAEVYSRLIDNYIDDVDEKNILFQAGETMPCMIKKRKWATDWITSNASFAKRLIAFAIVEGIFFSGAFCAIYFFKEQNILHGLTQSNEYIARDEGLHTEYACYLYKNYFPDDEKLSQNEVNEMIDEAVDLEDEFINISLPCKLVGMNSNDMKEYIRFVADRLLRSLGYDKYYYAKNPFPFMEKISIEEKTNFFEKRNTNYKMATINNISFIPDDDF